MIDIKHEIKVKSPPDQIRMALETVDGIGAWHGGGVTREDGGWRIDIADGPTFRWTVQPEGSNQIVWRCEEGPGDARGTTAEFTLSPTDDGRTLVAFAHRGWPHDGGNFRKCNTHWAVLLHHLRRYAETGAHAPAFGS